MEISPETRKFFSDNGKESVKRRKAKYGGEAGFKEHMKYVSRSRKTKQK